MKERLRLLLVDDDLDDREIFLMALETSGSRFECRTAGNGVEALHILDTDESPDIIFLDMNMPRMNGLECLEKIRSSPRFDDCEIYIYTTIEDPDILKKSAELNAACIVKPPSARLLSQILERILSSNSNKS